MQIRLGERVGEVQKFRYLGKLVELFGAFPASDDLAATIDRLNISSSQKWLDDSQRLRRTELTDLASDCSKARKLDLDESSFGINRIDPVTSVADLGEVGAGRETFLDLAVQSAFHLRILANPSLQALVRLSLFHDDSAASTRSRQKREIDFPVIARAVCVARVKCVHQARSQMTFCVATRVDAGIIALADTRIVKGGERLSKAKLAMHLTEAGTFFTMTSGLRSIRDKMLIYGEEALSTSENDFRRLYQVVNLFGRQLKKVAEEDSAALAKSGLSFNLHAIVGGRLADDPAPTLFLIYPEGNWIEVNDDSPYFMIGRTPYGRPLMDRYLRPSISLSQAALMCVLAFDMTASCVTDVDYPIDMAILRTDGEDFERRRFDQGEMSLVTAAFYSRLEQSLQSIDTQWINQILGQADASNPPAC